MAPSLRPLFTTFFSLLLFLLLHLGCFFLPFNYHHHHHQHHHQIKKRKASHHSLPTNLSAHSAFSSSWKFLKRVFSVKRTKHGNPSTTQASPKNTSIPSPASSIRSLQLPSILSLPLLPEAVIISGPPSKRPASFHTESDIPLDQLFFPHRNGIHPCPACGEVFVTLSLLEQHQFIKHAVSELSDGESGKNVVGIIFKTGWPDKGKVPVIHRVLKIHNSPKTLSKFEEYRECVKAKASRQGSMRRRDERCIADGNELLRFHCTTFMCDLGQNGNSSLCNRQYCSVCEIIRSGFSPKMDGVSTLPTSWRAHVAIPEEIEDEFGFLHVKRAMLVCRVIAGRVGCNPAIADKQDSGFDSLVGTDRNESGVQTRLDEEDELLVFNPRAVLPCFVIVYTVCF